MVRRKPSLRNGVAPSLPISSVPLRVADARFLLEPHPTKRAAAIGSCGAPYFSEDALLCRRSHCTSADSSNPSTTSSPHSRRSSVTNWSCGTRANGQRPSHELGRGRAGIERLWIGPAVYADQIVRAVNRPNGRRAAAAHEDDRRTHHAHGLDEHLGCLTRSRST